MLPTVSVSINQANDEDIMIYYVNNVSGVLLVLESHAYRRLGQKHHTFI